MKPFARKLPAAVSLTRCMLLVLSAIPASLVTAADKVDFERDVVPIFRQHCVGCHAGDDAEAGFDIETPAGLLAGGDSGVAVTPGAASSSRLYLMLSGKLEPVMPPEDEPPLDEQQQAIIAAWIDQGAEVSAEMPLKVELRTPRIEPRADIATPATAIAISPDGAIRAVARYGEIELRDPHGDIIRTISGEFGKVNSLQFNRAGSQLLVASGVAGAYGAAAIYDLSSGQRVTELVGHRDILYAAVFSPDESLVATAGYDRQILLWDLQTSEPRHVLSGHNGAIFDLAFSPDGKVLISGCADETVKVWSVATGARLDTLNQSEGEVLAVDITPDGNWIVAASADNRLRVWQLVSTDQPAINPLVATRFIDDSPLVNFRFTPDGNVLVVLSQSGNVSLVRTSDWNQAATLPPLGETGTDIAFPADGNLAIFSLMNGQIVQRELPSIETESHVAEQSLTPIYLDLGEPQQLLEQDLRQQQSAVADETDKPIDVGRGVQINGAISNVGESDFYRWPVRRGEVWAIDADATTGSAIDPIVSILDAQGEPIPQARLQAIRESYFTFRGKDSTQTSDFRLFNWEEMKLNQFLFAAGEVTRLSMHPRGPDSGFNVYPDDGPRWTYFGTSHRAHALNEPAYIVRPIGLHETPIANGLPVFDLNYENDDDPMRIAGNSSRLLFTAPTTGQCIVKIRDTRGEGGAGFDYQLSIRAAQPRFHPSFDQPPSPILKGTGREFTVRVDRFDGFDGPVTFEIVDLPAGLISNSPITVEAGQRFATANLWADESTAAWEGEQTARLIAHATVAGRHVEREVGVIGKLMLGDRPSAIPSLHPITHEVSENEAWTLQVRRGETATARILVRRKAGFQNEIRFGNETSARNPTHGVYVDNIGLSGLLVRENESEREFFLTADPVAQPGKRAFHLQAQIDGNVTTYPIVVEVLP
jgi:hypothetical protein